MSQYAHLSILDPEFAEALAPFPPGSGPTQDVAEMQRGFEGLIEMLNERDKALFPCASELRIEDHKVPIDGSKITVRCMIPMPAGDSAGPFPVLVNYHAGDFVIGGLNTDSLWLQQVCVEQQVSVVDIDYRLAPEFPWPIQHEDSYTAVKWVVENTAIFRADLTKGFIVGGTSAGGNISASLALRARDDPFFQGRPLTGQLLQIPPTVSPSTSRTSESISIPSARTSQRLMSMAGRFKTELISMDMPLDISGFADKQAALKFWEWWKPDHSDTNTWVLLHPNHAGVAPAVIQVCGADPLRDEELLYEKLLTEAGVRTKLHVYPGVPHEFHVVLFKLGWEDSTTKTVRMGFVGY